jgi:general stress protein CsbA
MTTATTIAIVSHPKKLAIPTFAIVYWRHVHAMRVARNRIAKRSRVLTAKLFENTPAAHSMIPAEPVPTGARNMWNLMAGLGICVLPVLFALTIRSSWVAIILSAAGLTALLHLASYMGAGYIDPFFIISIPVSFGAFFVWSALVIWIARRLRRAQRKSVEEAKEGGGKDG